MGLDWTTIIITGLTLLITGGGLVTIVTLNDKKSGAILDNLKSLIDSAHRTNDEWKEISDAREKRIGELKSDLDRKDTKIDNLYKEISVLRDKADNLSSKVAYLNTIKCKEIGCQSRRPPFGTREEECRIEMEVKQ